MQKSDPFDGEIELIDILRVLWKRKSLIVLGTLLLTVGAAVGSYLLPDAYEITTIVEPGKRPISNENGQIIHEKALQSPEAIKEAVLGGAFDEGISNKLQISTEDFPEIKAAVPKNTDLVMLSIVSSEPHRAKAVLEEIVTKVSEDITEKIHQEKMQIENDIKLAQIDFRGKLKQTALLESQINETRSTIIELEADRRKAMASRTTDAVAVLLYSNEIQNNQIYLADLHRRLADLRQESQSAEIKIQWSQMRLAGLKATRVHKKPTISPNPVKPKKFFIVALAFLIGMTGTTMLAFLLEYVQCVAKEEWRQADGTVDLAGYRSDAEGL